MRNSTRNGNRPRSRRSSRSASPTTEVLVGAALDLSGAMIVMAGVVALGGDVSYRVGLLICLAIAGLDLIFRTSIRQALIWTLKGLGQGLNRLFSRLLRRRSSTPPPAPSASSGQPPDTTGEPLPELSE